MAKAKKKVIEPARVLAQWKRGDSFVVLKQRYGTSFERIKAAIMDALAEESPYKTKSARMKDASIAYRALVSSQAVKRAKKLAKNRKTYVLSTRT